MNDFAQLQTVAGDRLRTILELREELRAARSQIQVLEQKMESAKIYRHWRWRQFLKRLCGVRLGITPHYSPRAISVPASYTKAPSIDWPLISIVTPSFNQGRFLERTIRSVLDQHYPKLEYIIKDGGSLDETVDILKRYKSSLTFCESAKDRSQAHALNLGFRHASGEIMAYLNSDDMLLPGALAYVAAYFAEHPEVDVVYGHRVIVDAADREIGRWVLPPHSDRMLVWADYVP